MALTVERGSVVHLDVDAIVNAANSQLMNGGGVALAIEKAAGPQLAKACRQSAPCPTGDVRVTPGFNLKARLVIHAVGPIWSGGHQREEELLRRCYRRILEEADTAGVSTLGAVPLSIGIFGYPMQQGCAIAVEELSAAPPSMSIRLMAFKDSEFAMLQKLQGASASAEAQAVIRFYDKHKPYFEFTNFSPHDVTVDGVRWPTAEHYYQAQKFADPSLQAQVRAAPSPAEARALGGRLKPQKARFHDGKRDVMRTALLAKFTQHPDLRDLLIGTGDAELVEASPKDSYWGEGADGSGKNWLGKLLMELRDSLRASSL